MLASAPARVTAPHEGRFLFVLALVTLGSIAFGASWLAPNHYPPWTSFHGEAAAFAALFLFCLARTLSVNGVTGGRAPVALGLLLVLVWAQWVTGQIAYGGDALVSGFYLVGCGLAWWLGTNSVPNARFDPTTLFASIVLTGAVLSIFIALLQWLRLESLFGIFATDRGPQTRAYGNLGQPNHLATLALVGTVSAAALYVRGTLKGRHFIALVVWFSIGLTLTESRTATLGAVALGLLLIAKGNQVPSIGKWRVVLGWWTLLLVLAWLWPSLNEALYLQPSRDVQLTRDHARQVIWLQCLEAIGQAPWLGYGWRQTMAAQKVGAHYVDGWLATDYAHNVMLDIFLWVGLPLGLLMVCVALCWYARVAIRTHGPTQLFLFATTVPLVVHSMFEFPFAYSYFLLPASWVCGRLSMLQSAACPTPPRRLARGIALLVTLAFGLVGAALSSEYLVAEEDYRVMRFELRRIGRTPEAYAPPDLKLLTQLDELLKLGRLKPMEKRSAAEVERLGIASANFGWATLHLNYVVALGLSGRAIEASQQLGLLRAVYGPESYTQATAAFRELALQSPELATVRIP
jgi:hypothetical protein